MIGNGETFTARDYIDPDLIHTIEITPDAPLHCRSLHTVGKTTFDCFDVAVVGTVEFSQPNDSALMLVETPFQLSVLW